MDQTYLSMSTIIFRKMNAVVFGLRHVFYQSQRVWTKLYAKFFYAKEFCELNHGQLLYLLFVCSFVCSFVCLFVRLFVCLFVWYRSTREYSLIWRRHHFRWRAENFDLSSALMAIEQWGFFNVPHLIWHGASVYNSHLRGPVTLSPITERLAVELSYLVCRGWDSNKPKPSACGANL